MVFTLFGLQQGGLHTTACRDRCHGILTFLTRLTNHYLNSAEYTFLFITTSGQASADTDKRRDTVRDQTRFQQVSTEKLLCKIKCKYWKYKLKKNLNQFIKRHFGQNVIFQQKISIFSNIYIYLTSISLKSLLQHCVAHCKTYSLLM